MHCIVNVNFRFIVSEGIQIYKVQVQTHNPILIDTNINIEKNLQQHTHTKNNILTKKSTPKRRRKEARQKHTHMKIQRKPGNIFLY